MHNASDDNQKPMVVTLCSGLPGVVSGVYIFQPIFEEERQKA
jgi:hypothetical protein